MNIVFENIEQAIIAEINKAENWIKINVPWFTSVELLQSLYSAESRGIDIELIIEDDKVNNKLKKLFEGLERLGCTVIFNKNKEKLNHEKFAIIDGETLIYGSFNWTNKANLYNNESIFILNKEDNKSIIESYKSRFESIKDSITSIHEHALTFDIKKNYYEQLDSDSENCKKPLLIPFCHDGKWGYCNSEKEIVVDPIYLEANRFSEGFASVKNTSDKWAFINENGQFITPFKFDSCKDFKSGWASVAREIDTGGYMGPGYYLQFGAIDKFGEQILPFKYAHLGILSEGKIDFSPSENIGKYYDDAYDIDENLPKGIIDYKGIVLTDRTFDIIYPCSEGFNMVCNSSQTRYSYVDRYGNLLNDFTFYSADRFSSGFAAIRIPINFDIDIIQNNYCNYIDKTGDFVFEQHIHKTESFFQGTAYLETKKKSMIVNSNFDEIINCKISNSYSICSNFYNGIAKYTDGKKYGYINRSGQTITDCIYTNVGRYYYGVAVVGNSNGQTEFINTDGEKILECSAKNLVIRFHNNLGIIEKPGGYYYFDCEGQIYTAETIIG